MAEYVDLSERVTATFYSDEYEEWTQKTVTIADVLNAVCDDYTALPSAQPVNIAKLQPNCNQVASDCISRQAAINAADSIIERDTSGNNDVVKAMTAWKEYIKGMPSAQPGWIPCSEKMPPDYQWYYATCKSLVDNRENWVVEGCYTPWEHFNSTPMIKCGEAEVIAWMPKGFPEPWEGGQDEQN